MLGAEVQLGTFDDLDVLARAAGTYDGVIHLAFKHDIAFSGGFEGAAAAVRRAIETFGDALAGTDQPLAIASGVLGLMPGHVSTELDGHGSDASTGHRSAGPAARLANAELTLSFVARGIRSSVMRLSPTVHGGGDQGFMATIIAIARDRRISGYIGDGSNRWPAVHRFDVARLFRLAVESAPAGSTLHAVADEGVPVRDVAEVIGRHLDVPVVAIAPHDAGGHFTWLANFLAIASPSSNAITRALLR